MRADQLLVHRALAPSRSAAQRLIERGAVRWLGPRGWAVPKKAGEDLPDTCELEITDDAELRFVSRGGLKLDGALTHTGIDVRGKQCLDIGQGTGGFTDVLLQRGAARVVGLGRGPRPVERAHRRRPARSGARRHQRTRRVGHRLRAGPRAAQLRHRDGRCVLHLDDAGAAHARALARARRRVC